jgi:plasmid stabilization system protein ParE
MTRYRVIVEPPASEELEEAFLWIARKDRDAAIRWFAGMEKTIESLATFPERLPFAPENDFFEEEIRQIVYGRRAGRYQIFFTIRSEAVHVLHIRHGARDYWKPSEPEI